MKLQNGFSCTMHCATKDYKLTAIQPTKTPWQTWTKYITKIGNWKKNSGRVCQIMKCISQHFPSVIPIFLKSMTSILPNSLMYIFFQINHKVSENIQLRVGLNKSGLEKNLLRLKFNRFEKWKKLQNLQIQNSLMIWHNMTLLHFLLKKRSKQSL